MPPQTFDCTTCGACCLSAHERYVALLPEDRARPIPPGAVREIEGRRYMRMEGLETGCGRCASLAATPDGRLICSVYDLRPEACRAFRAGSFECLRTRRARLAEADRLRLGTAGGPEEPPRAA